MTYQLLQGDCLTVLPGLPANSVNLILTDPPYFRVKSAAWDRQWDTAAAYLAWLDRVLEQFERVLVFNGSLYLFASPQMAARVEVLVGQRFHVLNSITWIKDAGWHKKAEQEALRAYFPQTERIIFAEHYGADNMAKGEAGYVAKCDELRGFVFEPLRAYFAAEKERAGVGSMQIMDYFESHGWPRYVTARHTFSRSQWELPTKENYERLRECFHAHNHGGDYLRREYEDLRRPFAVTASVPYTDVWDFATVQSYPGKHPCEKPAALLEHIITASSRPGAVVLDAFMGSGSTGKAARRLERDFIGIEADERWCDYAQQNIRIHSRCFSYPDTITPGGCALFCPCTIRPRVVY